MPRAAAQTLLEWSLILLWAAFVGRAYLSLDPTRWPAGAEFGQQAYHVFAWSLLKECGPCGLWNGYVNGGNPSLADWWSNILHPALAIPALLLHPIDAVKWSVVLSLAMGGLAQWWIGHVLGLGLVARLWGAAFGVVGGHLTGRMEYGWNVTIMSIAAASMTIAPALSLVLTGRRRAAVAFAVALALTLVTGHGYMQVAILLCMGPALLPFLVDAPGMARRRFLLLALSSLLAVLLAGLYLVPLLHFSPSFGKLTAPDFIGAQTIQYVPLNLVISDRAFYSADVLGKKPAIQNYYGFIGWLPVVLAAAACCLAPRRAWRVLGFFLIAIALTFFLTSATPLRWLQPVLPIATGRHPSVYAFFAVPFVLGLAAWGVDLLLRVQWPTIIVGLSSVARVARVPTVAAFLGILAWGVLSLYDTNRSSLRVESLPDDYHALARVLATEPTGWVHATQNDLRWLGVLPQYGLKTVIGPFERGWGWAGRQSPPPTYLEESADSVQAMSTVLAHRGDLAVLTDRTNRYAYVDTGAVKLPCAARPRGGSITVECDTSESGTLVVHENNYDGWSAWRDGERVSLARSDWLVTSAPAGRHRYEFHYQPWDVPLGLLITMLGILVAVAIWFEEPPRGLLNSGSGSQPK